MTGWFGLCGLLVLILGGALESGVAMGCGSVMLGFAVGGVVFDE